MPFHVRIPRPGLYHFAIRFPTRRDLAQALLRVTAAEYPIDGASDHGMGESIHLTDADGNGVELYADRPRSEWPRRNGQLHLFTQALDFNSLLATAGGGSLPENAPEQTDAGHINLHVADLTEAEKFFHEFLAFDVIARIQESATFLGAVTTTTLP
jgi:catechol 2,3-dioxygenase